MPEKLAVLFLDWLSTKVENLVCLMILHIAATERMESNISQECLRDIEFKEPDSEFELVRKISGNISSIWLK